jgi:hypothetical protein
MCRNDGIEDTHIEGKREREMQTHMGGKPEISDHNWVCRGFKRSASD